jgi:transposase
LVKTEDSAVGFYALNGESLVRWTENETKERILLVLDKHGSHICEYTRKRAHQLGIDLIFLPSGSPHLNPIEQVWKQLKSTMSSIIVRQYEYVEEEWSHRHSNT